MLRGEKCLLRIFYDNLRIFSKGGCMVFATWQCNLVTRHEKRRMIAPSSAEQETASLYIQYRREEI